MTVGRLPLASRFLGTDRRAAAIYITDPQNPFDLDSAKLRRLYKLTPAEARLAAHLARGSRLEDAAADLGVSLNTVGGWSGRAGEVGRPNPVDSATAEHQKLDRRDAIV